MEFLSAPDSYYDSLKEKLKTAKITVKEDMKRLQVRTVPSRLFCVCMNTPVIRVLL